MLVRGVHGAAHRSLPPLWGLECSAERCACAGSAGGATTRVVPGGRPAAGGPAVRGAGVGVTGAAGGSWGRVGSWGWDGDTERCPLPRDASSRAPLGLEPLPLVEGTVGHEAPIRQGGVREITVRGGTPGG
ncbi:hypothetical protein SXIM_39600 [Streptomyces xiamenensis]|uniref:Uncharacterized protein n=1 Tax=Streptomyces xiamenensis TaxID=408015 RepID=A0A0F7FZ17_9ACTN|nr:hypothetical protein SXIM_39600 [Streptomyces xiamenensis]